MEQSGWKVPARSLASSETFVEEEGTPGQVCRSPQPTYAVAGAGTTATTKDNAAASTPQRVPRVTRGGALAPRKGFSARGGLVAANASNEPAERERVVGIRFSDLSPNLADTDIPTSPADGGSVLVRTGMGTEVNAGSELGKEGGTFVG